MIFTQLLYYLQVFSVLIKHENFTPNETKNPFLFENHSLTSYVYKLNGLQVSDRIEVDFDQNKYLRAYRSLIGVFQLILKIHFFFGIQTDIQLLKSFLF